MAPVSEPRGAACACAPGSPGGQQPPPHSARRHRATLGWGGRHGGAPQVHGRLSVAFPAGCRPPAQGRLSRGSEGGAGRLPGGACWPSPAWPGGAAPPACPSAGRPESRSCRRPSSPRPAGESSSDTASADRPSTHLHVAGKDSPWERLPGPPDRCAVRRTRPTLPSTHAMPGPPTAAESGLSFLFSDKSVDPGFSRFQKENCVTFTVRLVTRAVTWRNDAQPSCGRHLTVAVFLWWQQLKFTLSQKFQLPACCTVPATQGGTRVLAGAPARPDGKRLRGRDPGGGPHAPCLPLLHWGPSVGAKSVSTGLEG